MKNIIEKLTLGYVDKNGKYHSLYYDYCQEDKMHSKKDKNWQNDKQHHSYLKNVYKEHWFNGKIVK